MWGSFFSGGKDPLKDLGYEVSSDNQQTTTSSRSIWTILNGKKKVYEFDYHSILSLKKKDFLFFRQQET